MITEKIENENARRVVVVLAVITAPLWFFPLLAFYIARDAYDFMYERIFNQLPPL